jgi:hypothetical protein
VDAGRADGSTASRSELRRNSSLTVGGVGIVGAHPEHWCKVSPGSAGGASAVLVILLAYIGHVVWYAPSSGAANTSWCNGELKAGKRS